VFIRPFLKIFRWYLCHQKDMFIHTGESSCFSNYKYSYEDHNLAVIFASSSDEKDGLNQKETFLTIGSIPGLAVHFDAFLGMLIALVGLKGRTPRRSEQPVPAEA
jgi:hypothetical protein